MHAMWHDFPLPQGKAKAGGKGYGQPYEYGYGKGGKSFPAPAKGKGKGIQSLGSNQPGSLGQGLGAVFSRLQMHGQEVMKHQAQRDGGSGRGFAAEYTCSAH